MVDTTGHGITDGFVERVAYDAALARVRQLEDALRLIRDGRCICGGRFKWTGVQMRCEQCDRHAGNAEPKAREIARSVLLTGSEAE